MYDNLWGLENEKYRSFHNSVNIVPVLVHAGVMFAGRFRRLSESGILRERFEQTGVEYFFILQPLPMVARGVQRYDP